MLIKHNAGFTCYQDIIYFPNFAVMKKNSFITSLISVVGLVFFLAASTGVTVVKHFCDHCSDATIVMGFVAESQDDSNTCCSEDGCHSEGTRNEAGTKGCCNIEMSLLKVTNYIPEIPRSVSPELLIIPVIYHDITPSLPEKTILTAFAGQERYGGRSKVTLHHQLII